MLNLFCKWSYKPSIPPPFVIHGSSVPPAGGTDDPCITNGGGIDGLYDHLQKRFNNVSIKKFKGMRHEIQNEQCKDELLNLMESFISNE